MTLVIGVRCGDGIVIGADSVATYALPNGVATVEQVMDSKIHKVDDKLLYAFAGDISLGQDVMHSLSKSWKRDKGKSKENIKKSMSKAVVEPIQEYAERSDSVRSMMRAANGAGPCNHLYSRVCRKRPTSIDSLQPCRTSRRIHQRANFRNNWKRSALCRPFSCIC